MSGIFISYRREDSAASAGRLCDWIRKHFGKEQVFMDVDTIPLGADFVEEIERRVGACDVLIALIGRTWCTCVDEEGKRRLDNPEDLVRVEIAAALNRNVRVIPVLVDGSHIPGSDELPGALAKLARRNALELSHAKFASDVGSLVSALEKAIAAADEEKRKAEVPIHVPPRGPVSEAATKERRFEVVGMDGAAIVVTGHLTYAGQYVWEEYNGPHMKKAGGEIAIPWEHIQKIKISDTGKTRGVLRVMAAEVTYTDGRTESFTEGDGNLVGKTEWGNYTAHLSDLQSIAPLRAASVEAAETNRNAAGANAGGSAWKPSGMLPQNLERLRSALGKHCGELVFKGGKKRPFIALWGRIRGDEFRYSADLEDWADGYNRRTPMLTLEEVTQVDWIEPTSGERKILDEQREVRKANVTRCTKPQLEGVYLYLSSCQAYGPEGEEYDLSDPAMMSVVMQSK